MDNNLVFQVAEPDNDAIEAAQRAEAERAEREHASMLNNLNEDCGDFFLVSQEDMYLDCATIGKKSRNLTFLKKMSFLK
jgi:hypothetical protein